MKRSTYSLSRILSFLLPLTPCLSPLFVSCEYKDLCYDHNHTGDVTINFDWAKEPDTRVDGMTVLFYNVDAPQSEPLRYDFAGMDGGHARLQPGTYRAVAYNYDTETILYRGLDAHNLLEAYTRNSSIEEGTQLSRSDMPRAANTEDEPVILEPDPLYGTYSEPFTVPANGQCSVTMLPESRVNELEIIITNVPNLQYSTQFGGALSGLAPSVWMESGVPGEGHVTQAFTATVVGESTLEMHTRVFGHCPEGEEDWPHLLTIYAILADGNKWYYVVDVTDQMHPEDEPDPSDHDREIVITLDELPVPKPIVNGSGFQPTIDGWQGVEIDVTMD